MAEKRKRNGSRKRRDPGTPGGGAGRKDEAGGSGVYPASAESAPEDSILRGQAEWGQGERGAAGYEDSGASEIFFTEEELKKIRREGKAPPSRGGSGEDGGRGD